MKCLLCNGRGFLYMESDDSILGDKDIIPVECPRCEGTKREDYISIKNGRTLETIKAYCTNYRKFFVYNDTNILPESILKKI